MKLVVGLGNPGPKYETTRHNVGFLALDRLIDAWRATGPTHKEQGEVWQATVKGERVLLIKPLTFMNLSGRTVAPIFKFHKCEPRDLIVLHDELDLDLNALRIKAGGGSGGHNGLKSLDESLGADLAGYFRVRIGVGHPSRRADLIERGVRMNPADYVLAPFDDIELKVLDTLFGDVVGAVEQLLEGNLTTAQNRYHSRGLQGAEPGTQQATKQQATKKKE